VKRQDTLELAGDVIDGDRLRDYGSARDNFTRTAKLWEQVLGTTVTPEQFALCMILVKVDRLTQSPGHEDSWVDICGYAALGSEIATEEVA
jgi:hypothetical protein